MFAYRLAFPGCRVAEWLGAAIRARSAGLPHWGTMLVVMGCKLRRECQPFHSAAPVCVLLMSKRRLHQFAFRELRSPHRHRLKVRATHFPLSGRELDYTRQPPSSSSQLRSGRSSPSLLRLCEDRTRFRIFCASTLTRAGSFCPPPRSMAARELSLSASSMTSSFSSDLRRNGSPQPQKRTCATGRSWLCTETSLGGLMMTQTKPPFSRHSLAPRGIPRLHTFHTSPRRQSDVCSGSTFPLCCFLCACSA